MSGSEQPHPLLPVALDALRRWELRPKTVDLASVSENVVFRVTTEDGARYVLRVHRPGYHTLNELVSEQLWTAGLREGGIAVPEPVATRDGSHYATATLPGGQEQRHIGLYHWVDGIPLREHLGESPKVSVVERWYSEIGRIAATIHTVTEGWEPPDEFRRHSFDADGMAGETPFWGRYWDHPALSDGARNELANIRKHVHLRLNELSKARGGYGMIHADLHAGNVLVAADGLHVIDFDDAGFGWHQYELAVALFGQEDEPHFETARTALFDGYRRQRPVDDDFFEPVPLFLLVRGLALIGWLMERPEHDGTERLDHLVKGARTQARSLFPNLTR